MNKNTEANKLFNEFMFATENGTLVISRDDFKTIMKRVNLKGLQALDKVKEDNNFERMFHDEEV